MIQKCKNTCNNVLHKLKKKRTQNCQKSKERGHRSKYKKRESKNNKHE